jgi:hypothetical protein
MFLLPLRINNPEGMNKELFRTVVNAGKASDLITPDDAVLFMGSCFAGNMGAFMSEARFPVAINPFGVLYNPMSIGHAFNALIQNATPTSGDLFFNNDLWHSFFHHGKFSHPDREVAVEQIQEATLAGHLFLKKTRFLVITFGSAYVYEHKGLQQVVANCHKFPETEFSRYLLEPEEIVEAYKDLIVRLRVFNPALNIIFTVSPVRHLKDGAHGNQLSKAVLLLAVEKLTTLFEKVTYFPAYEIVLDELRDYRFFDEAMTQPNPVAVKYVWQRFMESSLSADAQHFFKEMQQIIRARNHRPSGHATTGQLLFIQNTLELIDSLSVRYPEAFLDDDRDHFKKILEKF